ncbi:MAG: hypothetical protein KC503_02665 [Myxococcales bacterium]|nr:hypothetical protein [Myxococcales bacterium]
MIRSVIASALALLVVAPGCSKKDDVPEHVKQQREAEKRRKAAAAARKSKTNPTGATSVRAPRAAPGHPGHDDSPGAGSGSGDKTAVAKKYDDRLWPKRVRAAFQLAWKASPAMTPRATRLLAMQGLEATKALRALIESPFAAKHKRAAAAFLLARLHMFRPADLASMAREHIHQALQRECLRLLTRIRNPDVDKLVQGVVEHEPLFKPFVAMARKVHKTHEWKLTIDDINRLDNILQGRRPDELRKELGAIEGKAAKRMREPLLEMLRSPVTRKQVYMMVGARLLELADGDPKQQRIYVEPGYPRVLRLGAAQLLLKAKRKSDLAYLNKIASNPKDPLSVPLRMLMVRARGPKPKRQAAAKGK